MRRVKGINMSEISDPTSSNDNILDEFSQTPDSAGQQNCKPPRVKNIKNKNEKNLRLLCFDGARRTRSSDKAEPVGDVLEILEKQHFTGPVGQPVSSPLHLEDVAGFGYLDLQNLESMKNVSFVVFN